MDTTHKSKDATRKAERPAPNITETQEPSPHLSHAVLDLIASHIIQRIRSSGGTDE